MSGVWRWCGSIACCCRMHPPNSLHHSSSSSQVIHQAPPQPARLAPSLICIVLQCDDEQDYRRRWIMLSTSRTVFSNGIFHWLAVGAGCWAARGWGGVAVLISLCSEPDEYCLAVWWSGLQEEMNALLSSTVFCISHCTDWRSLLVVRSQWGGRLLWYYSDSARSLICIVLRWDDHQDYRQIFLISSR